MNKIRLAKIKDCVSCHELANTHELLTPNKNPPPLWWFESIVKEKQILILYEEKNKTIGFIMGERLASNNAIIHLISVKKGERNKGVGKSLLAAFENECSKRKLKYILTYGYSKKSTINFFQKNGFSKGSPLYELVKKVMI